MNRSPGSRARLVVIATCAVAAVGCATPEASPDEAAKAGQLQAELSAIGKSIDTTTAVALFDSDGGHLCGAAGSADDLANVALVGHRFALRKIVVSPDDIASARAVIDVYCPDELATFDDYTAGLVTGETGDD